MTLIVISQDNQTLQPYSIASTLYLGSILRNFVISGIAN
jgi:hypothetical protein